MNEYANMERNGSMQTTGIYQRVEQPIFVGAWQMGGPQGFNFNITKRPRWLTRVMMKFLIEWEWFDEPTVSQPEPPDVPK